MSSHLQKHAHHVHQTESEQLKTILYFTNWAVYGKKHFVKDLDADKLTHVFYAFIGIDSSTGNVRFTDSWADIELPLDSIEGSGKVTGNLQQLYQLKKKNRKLKAVMSIGGWGTEYLFNAVMLDSGKINNFVSSSVAMLLEYGFDGIDIDWEYPQNKEQGQQLVDLLAKFRLKLDEISPSLVLSVAAPGGADNIANLNLKEMDKYLSFWNIMCYDFAGSGWSSKIGFHSNLFGSNGDTDLNSSDIISTYRNGGVPANKLILGMPMYARAFYVPNPSGEVEIGQDFDKSNPTGSDTLDYKNLPVDVEKFDAKKVSAYSYNTETKLWAGYDNPQSSRIKATWIKLNGLGGGMWWDSAGDDSNPDRSLLANFVDQIGGVDTLDQSENKLDYDSTYLKPVQ